jgi:hypothetical protein
MAAMTKTMEAKERETRTSTREAAGRWRGAFWGCWGVAVRWEGVWRAEGWMWRVGGLWAGGFNAAQRGPARRGVPWRGQGMGSVNWGRRRRVREGWEGRGSGRGGRAKPWSRDGTLGARGGRLCAAKADSRPHHSELRSK